MTEKVAKVLNGFTNLTLAEREEFIKELTRYRNSTSWEKPEIERDIQKGMSVGPKNTICTCCGR